MVVSGIRPAARRWLSSNPATLICAGTWIPLLRSARITKKASSSFWQITAVASSGSMDSILFMTEEVRSDRILSITDGGILFTSSSESGKPRRSKARTPPRYLS